MHHAPAAVSASSAARSSVLMGAAARRSRLKAELPSMGFLLVRALEFTHPIFEASGFGIRLGTPGMLTGAKVPWWEVC